MAGSSPRKRNAEHFKKCWKTQIQKYKTPMWTTCVQNTKSAIISRVLVGSPPRKHTSSAVQVRGSRMQYVPVYYTIGLFRCFTNQTTSAMQAATVGPCGCWPRNHQIQLLDYEFGQRKSTQESPDTTFSLNYSGLWVGSEEGIQIFWIWESFYILTMRRTMIAGWKL